MANIIINGNKFSLSVIDVAQDIGDDGNAQTQYCQFLAKDLNIPLTVGKTYSLVIEGKEEETGEVFKQALKDYRYCGKFDNLDRFNHPSLANKYELKMSFKDKEIKQNVT